MELFYGNGWLLKPVHYFCKNFASLIFDRVLCKLLLSFRKVVKLIDKKFDPLSANAIKWSNTFKQLLECVWPFCRVGAYRVETRRGQLKSFSQYFRSSRVVLQQDALENFTNLAGKHLCWILFLIKLNSSLDSDTGVFMRFLYSENSSSIEHPWTLPAFFLKIATFLGTEAATCPRPATLFKKRLWLRRFPVNFAKFLRMPFWQNTSGWLLLYTPSQIRRTIIFKNLNHKKKVIKFY